MEGVEQQPRADSGHDKWPGAAMASPGKPKAQAGEGESHVNESFRIRGVDEKTKAKGRQETGQARPAYATHHRQAAKG